MNYRDIVKEYDDWNNGKEDRERMWSKHQQQLKSPYNNNNNNKEEEEEEEEREKRPQEVMNIYSYGSWTDAITFTLNPFAFYSQGFVLVINEKEEGEGGEGEKIVTKTLRLCDCPCHERSEVMMFHCLPCCAKPAANGDIRFAPQMIKRIRSSAP